jgi:hypothetical protein
MSIDIILSKGVEFVLSHRGNVVTFIEWNYFPMTKSDIVDELYSY